MSQIILKDIDKFYGSNHVLKHLNLTVNDGEFMTLLGPSGCGKTTTLRVVAGLERPQNGTIEMDGRLVVNAKELFFEDPGKRGLNLVFQSYALWPHMTVFDNVAFALSVKKLSKAEVKKRVMDALERMRIEEYAQRYPSELSGGQQQRVAIARAIVSQPKVLLLDEPLSNLDAKLRVEMRNAIKTIQQQVGITTVYVTHDQEEALTLSDRIAVFNKGFIEQIGTPNEVYNHSQTEFVCNFIGDINRLNDDTVSALRAAGAEVDASKHNYIRLERLHVNVAPRGGEIALDGTVESCEYYGLYIKYYIHVGTQSLKVIEKNDGVNIYEPAQQVSVVINPAHVMAYEAGEEAAHA